MSVFFDREAQESEGSEDDEVRQELIRSKKKKSTKSRPEIDSSEEEEDNDDEIAEEMRDLINDEEEEDAEESDDEISGRKRSHDEEEEDDDSLDSEDLDLIEENAGVRLQKKKKFKRIRRISDDEDEDEKLEDGEKIGRELFGDGDDSGTPTGDADQRYRRSASANYPDVDRLDGSDEEESESDEDDFIVDDNDEPISRPKKKKKGGSRHTDAAMQQAQEVFGVDFDFEDLEEEIEYDGDEEEDYADEDEEDEDEEGRSGRRTRKSRGYGRATRKSIYDVYEPAELERSHLTTFDNQVRLKDEPERFQLRTVPIKEADDAELEKEAAWIHEQAFNKRTISAIENDDHEPIAGAKPDTAVTQIVDALRYMRNEKLEVPVIAFYRREYVENLSINDMWVIYKLDEKWCRLKNSKDSLRKLYTGMQEYLQYKQSEDGRPDPRIRTITSNDIERVSKAANQTEIDDCRAHFNLYYSSHLQDMRLYKLKLVRQLKEEARVAKPAKVKDPDDPENDDFDAEKESEVEVEEEPGNEEEKLYERLSRFKISQRKNYYQMYRDMYVGNLVEKFGLKPEAFGENLRDDYQRNNVKQHQIKPLEEAEKQLEERTNVKISKEDFLKAARFMFAKEISCDPLVRQTIRKYYFENAVINTKPTPGGQKEIDENHPCYSMKYLRNKPSSTLSRDQFIHLSNAEKDKLIETTITIEPKDNESRGANLSPYHESLKGLYFSDFSSLVTKEWNDQREEAVKMAMDKFLLPTLEKELRAKLIQEAQDKIIKTCGQKLFDWLKIAPYTAEDRFGEDEDFELRNGLKVMGFASPSGPDSPSFAAIIDSEGEVVDHIRLPNLMIRKRKERMNTIEKENQIKDRVKFKQFIMHRKPHVIALAAESVQTKYVHDDLVQLMIELSENEGIPSIPIEIVDNELANVYMNSKKAIEDFPEYPQPLLQAVSIARRLADPLIEFSKLCSADNEILCIKYHPLQDNVPKEDLLTALNNEFINRVNEVGVDINRAIAHPHTSSVVQFICGLGPRKASHLLRIIRKLKSGQLTSRQQLIKDLGMTGIIYINCSGFIKLDTDVLAESYPDELVTTLDSTRIHPQSYGLAKKIASDALDYEEGASEETTAHAIEEILECPDKLGDLDLDAFAHELEIVRGEGKKTYTLYSIREELTNRYRDLRDPYKSPGPEEIFALLTKETPSTFFIGKLITCEVTAIIRKKPTAAEYDSANPSRIDGTGNWRCPFCFRCDFQELSEVWHHYDNNVCPGEAKGLRCRLDNGLQGFVPVKFISDKEVVDPSERVAAGMTVHARITKINIERYSCDLTCRSSDLLDREGKLKPIKDEYYDHKAEDEHEKMLESKSKKQVRRPNLKRIIVHPSFHNIDYKTAEERLSKMEQGAAIIRPSSMGPNYLTVSWKVADGINQHINIKEEGKDNAFSLGHQLFINDESYEDLDEIIARHIQPMASFARDMLNYKYCQPQRDRERDTLSDLLFTEKSRAPGKIHYFVCPSKDYPGKFLLSYLPRNKVRHEYISITPQGYRFRKNYFNSIGHLLRWFKENYHRDPHIMTTDRSLMSISSV